MTYYIHVYGVERGIMTPDSVDVEEAETIGQARLNLLEEFNRTTTSNAQTGVRYLVTKAMIAKAQVGQEFVWDIAWNEDGLGHSVYTHSIRTKSMFKKFEEPRNLDDI